MISKPITSTIDSNFDCLIVGSGYGGSITALRLKEQFTKNGKADVRIGILERGKEFTPGEFPESPSRVSQEVSMSTSNQDYVIGDAARLFDVSLYDNINFLVGSGLGGTSLINANVAIKPSLDVFKQGWPESISNNPEAILPYYQLATDALETGRSTFHHNKSSIFKESLSEIKNTFKPAPLNVTFNDSVNQAGIFQPGCNSCGNCVTGCNRGSKNTLMMNYLPRAAHQGVEIFTHCNVQSIERDTDGWLVRALDSQTNTPISLNATSIVLAAGAIGSTKILLRSQKSGLDLSKQLGNNINGNGDFLAFGINSLRYKNRVNSVGVACNQEVSDYSPGPCITGYSRQLTAHGYSILLEDGVAPYALTPILPALNSALTISATDPFEYGLINAEYLLTNSQSDILSATDPIKNSQACYQGLTASLQVFLIMGDDKTSGQLISNEQAFHINWSPNKTYFNDVIEQLNKVTKYSQSSLITPNTDDTVTNTLFSVHPLGGCAMSDNAELGVVNHYGAVYRSNNDLHPGLFVMDGSIIPKSIGVNPLLTISALSERAAEFIYHDIQALLPCSTDKAVANVNAPNSRQPSYVDSEFPQSQQNAITPNFPKLSKLSKLNNLLNFVTARQSNLLLSFEELLIAKKLESSSSKNAIASARFRVSTLKRPLMLDKRYCILNITSGQLQLTKTASAHQNLPVKSGSVFLERDSTQAYERHCIVYEVKLDHGMTFIGRKWLSLFDGELTEALVNMHYQLFENSKLLSQGELAMTKPGLMEQFKGAKIDTQFNSQIWGTIAEALFNNNTISKASLFKWYKTYQSVFDAVFKSYGKVATLLMTNNESHPSVQRRLNAPTPVKLSEHLGEQFAFRLTRYKGQGVPIILAPGYGVNASSFALPTVDENLVEFLTNGTSRQKRDVWLYDMRSSFDSGHSLSEFDLDDIALTDWPKVVDTILAITGQKQVQIIAHCVGSLTLLMSLLSGRLDKVKVLSVISSQLTIHPSTNWFNDLKAGVNLTEKVERYLKQESRPLNFSFESSAEHFDKTLDVICFNSPKFDGAACYNATCNRINAIYGPSYLHKNLNYQTHASLNQWFQPISTHAFKQLSRMILTKKITSASEKAIYLNEHSVLTDDQLPIRVPSLNLPIDFISGEDNKEFLPETTLLTYKWLQNLNAGVKHKYSRTVFKGYGHMDVFIGKAAAIDIFPRLLELLNRPLND